jgi:hypothetical protein
VFEAGRIDDLINKLELLVRNPQLKRQMRARGRERVEWQFSLDTYASTIENELLALLSPASLVGR